MRAHDAAPNDARHTPNDGRAKWRVLQRIQHLGFTRTVNHHIRVVAKQPDHDRQPPRLTQEELHGEPEASTPGMSILQWAQGSGRSASAVTLLVMPPDTGCTFTRGVCMTLLSSARVRPSCTPMARPKLRTGKWSRNRPERGLRVRGYWTKAVDRHPRRCVGTALHHPPQRARAQASLR